MSMMLFPIIACALFATIECIAAAQTDALFKWRVGLRVDVGVVARSFAMKTVSNVFIATDSSQIRLSSIEQNQFFQLYNVSWW